MLQPSSGADLVHVATVLVVAQFAAAAGCLWLGWTGAGYRGWAWSIGQCSGGVNWRRETRGREATLRRIRRQRKIERRQRSTPYQVTHRQPIVAVVLRGWPRRSCSPI